MPEPTEPKTFTQEDLDRIVGERIARAERDAKKAAQDALTDKLGGATLEDLLAAHKAQADAEDAAKTEAQRLRDEAAAEKATAAEERAAAARELHDARLYRALTAAGVPDDAVGTINVDVEVGATVEDIKTAVDALKVKVPALFGAVPAPQANPGDPAPKREAGEWGSEGLEEFKRRQALRQAAAS